MAPERSSESMEWRSGLRTLLSLVGPRQECRLESVIHFGADSVASENRIRRGGGRRFWPFQGEDDNEV